MVRSVLDAQGRYVGCLMFNPDDHFFDGYWGREVGSRAKLGPFKTPRECEHAIHAKHLEIRTGVRVLLEHNRPAEQFKFPNM